MFLKRVYIDNSLKDFTTRPNRGVSSSFLITPDTPIPKNWLKLLSNSKNKSGLFTLLYDYISCIPSEVMILVCTKGPNIVSNCHINVEDLQPCNHEEADTRCFYILPNQNINLL